MEPLRQQQQAIMRLIRELDAQGAAEASISEQWGLWFDLQERVAALTAQQ